MEAVFLRGLLLMSCFLLAQSLVCHFCSGVGHPRHCTNIKTCEDSEMCFTERIMRNNSIVFHNSGCASKQVCVNDKKKGLPCNSLRECVRFCNSDRCNKNPCGPSTRKRSCKEYKEAGLPSGVYTLDLQDGFLPLRVFCDMDTAGGGWTVFQRRKDGTVDFYRGWEAYKEGFGNLHHEFWLGNEQIYRLTKAGLTTLRVDLGDWEGNTAYAQYSHFQVGPVSGNYRLSISGYTGSAGDSLKGHNGFAFSTKDADHDVYKSNCATEFTGAWWYSKCHSSNLNGHYYAGGKAPYAKGVVWYHWKKYYYSLKSAEMKLREA